MSGLPRCHCGDDHLRVIHYRHNHSVFERGHFAISNYSEVQCQKCLTRWRTKAEWVKAIRPFTYCSWEA